MGPVRPNPIQRTVRSVHVCVYSSLCTIVAHITAKNRPDNFPSYPPDNHHCSDDVYLREGGTLKGTWSSDKHGEKIAHRPYPLLVHQLTQRKGTTQPLMPVDIGLFAVWIVFCKLAEQMYSWARGNAGKYTRACMTCKCYCHGDRCVLTNK